MVASSGYLSGKTSGENVRLDFQIQQSDLIANNALSLECPIDGYIVGMATVVDKTITTGGTLTVKTTYGNAANPRVITNTLTGITQTIANSAAKRTVTRTTSTAGDVTLCQVAKGDIIDIVPASFATAGSINGHLTINSSQGNP